MDNAIFLATANKYKDTIFRVAFNYLGNTFDADDVVQEVLLKLFTHKKSFIDDEHLKSWIIRVTINVCKNMLRSPWRKNSVNLEDVSATADLQFEDQINLFLTIMSLKDKYRIVLYLFYYEDYSVSQIAEILKVKESTVTTRLSRARKILKTEEFSYE